MGGWMESREADGSEGEGLTPKVTAEVAVATVSDSSK